MFVEFGFGPAPDTRVQIRHEMVDVARDIEVLTFELRELNIENMERALARIRLSMGKFEKSEGRRVENSVKRTLNSNRLQGRQISGNRR